MPTTEPFEAAAYGGAGWSPRTKSTQQEIGELWKSCGIQSEYAPLKSVLIHEPGEELAVSDNPNDMQMIDICLLYTSPSPRDKRQSRMPSSA